MKNSAIKKACALLLLLVGASTVWAAVDQEGDEINRSFTLPAKALVRVWKKLKPKHQRAMIHRIVFPTRGLLPRPRVLLRSLFRAS